MANRSAEHLRYEMALHDFHAVKAACVYSASTTSKILLELFGFKNIKNLLSHPP